MQLIFTSMIWRRMERREAALGRQLVDNPGLPSDREHR
jgi:hypothetical protein